MNECDWKVFKKIKEIALDKFCLLALEESQEVIADTSLTAHNRYLLLYKLLQNSDKKLALLFDGHSRSRAWLQLIAIRSEGLADKDLMEKLSNEFKSQTDPKQLE
jgi:hypothetical protein